MDSKTIDKLLDLSQLSLDDAEREVLRRNLESIINFVDVMATVDTTGIEPLAHPVDVSQPLRKDDPVDDIDRDQNQRIAPQTHSGLYLVPRVVQSR